MKEFINTQTKENFNPFDALKKAGNMRLSDRTHLFGKFISGLTKNNQNMYMRTILSPADREVRVMDPCTGQPRKMLMFGSNNYLGLANHPYVQEKVRESIKNYGVGIGGPPLLNGYTKIHHELEERLSNLKHSEDTIIFPTGYAANVGLVNSLINQEDDIFYDAMSHASFYDGLRMKGTRAVSFKHNQHQLLAKLLEQNANPLNQDRFIAVEGVYSMDGDLAPLDKIVPLCKKYNAYLILDDAHGTGVMGRTGAGCAEHFEMEDKVDISMGTFSKTLASIGGFVSASKPVIDYMRYFARSYMFSASLPPAIIAAVTAGLDIIEREPERIRMLHQKVNYAKKSLHDIGIYVKPEAAIISLRAPESINIRAAARYFNEMGIFLNAIEYPAVPLNEQRFRISLMAIHTREDIDQLVESIGRVWNMRDEVLRRKSLLAS